MAVMDPTTGQIIPNGVDPRTSAWLALQQNPYMGLGPQDPNAAPVQKAAPPPKMNPAGVMGLSPVLGDKGYAQLMDRANNMQLDSMNDQKKGIADQAAMLDQLKNNFQQKQNLAPLLALSDSWAGTNLTKGYTAPETLQDHQAMVAQLQDHLQKNKQGLTDSQIKLMKDQLDSKFQSAQLRALAGAAGGAKSEKDQDKALQNVQQLLESARGNPAAAQAERDIYAADKADSLAKMYPDPNKMPGQMVNLYTQELGKIASGGVPSMHELEGLTPGTLNGALASAYSKLANKPTAANMGEFIKQYQSYTGALRGDAQKVIQDKYGRVIESRKHQLGDDNYANLKTRYLDRFAPSSAAAPQAAGPQPGQVEDGHVFLGGDPSDPKSWKAQ